MKYLQKLIFLLFFTALFFSCTIDNQIAEEEAIYARSLLQEDNLSESIQLNTPESATLPDTNSEYKTGDDGGDDDITEKG